MEIVEKFKSVFMSFDNTKYILDNVAKKMSIAITNEIQSTLGELQQIIFDAYFENVYNEVLSKDSDSVLENTLVILNKVSMNKLECTILEHEKNKKKGTQRDVMSYYHLFSKDASLSNGRYDFPINEYCNVSSIKMESFTMNCNIYNVTELNNKFIVVEKGVEVVIGIPIGYYNVQDLVSTINDLLNVKSPNKFLYNITLHKRKNKVYIKCTHENIPFQFSLRFDSNLGEMLGFRNAEYTNNNLYVSEDNPSTNMLENVYLKFFMNDMEISKYSTSSRFTYFEKLSIQMNECFGKIHKECFSDMSPFDICERLDGSKISLELWTSQSKILTRFLTFDIVMSIEHSNVN